MKHSTVVLVWLITALYQSGPSLAQDDFPNVDRSQIQFDDVDQPAINFDDDFNFDGFANEEPSAVEIVLALACYGTVFLLFLTIWITILLTLSKSLSALPEAYRLMEPGSVWLLLIPFFNLIWIFFVFIRIPKSYQAYFHAVGRSDHGDCGEQLGLMYCICVVLSLIPCIGIIPGMISLPLMIIFVLKIHGLRKEVEQGHGKLPPQWKNA